MAQHFEANSKITSLQQDNGIAPHFGPRTSLWLYENLDGLFENTGMSNFMTAKAWAGYTKESSRTE
jgi:hypothetical protein